MKRVKVDFLEDDDDEGGGDDKRFRIEEEESGDESGEGGESEDEEIVEEEEEEEEGQDLMEVVGELKKKHGDRGRVMEKVVEKMKEEWGYHEEVIEMFMDFLAPQEVVKYVEAAERKRPLTVRVNTLQTSKKSLVERLRKRGVEIDAVPKDQSKVALIVKKSNVPIGATPEYLAGDYIIQSYASFFPVLALAPQPVRSHLAKCGDIYHHLERKSLGCLISSRGENNLYQSADEEFRSGDGKRFAWG